MQRVVLRLVLIALLLALVAVPSVASATTLATPAGELRPQPYQGWVDRALVPTPDGVVTLHLSACPVGPAWAAACVFLDHRSIHLGPFGRDRTTLLHELGHLFDEHVLTDADRARFRAITGARGPWHGEAADDPPEERFAEAYAFCARYRRLRSTRLGMYGYVATPSRQRAICALIRGAARRPG